MLGESAFPSSSCLLSEYLIKHFCIHFVRWVPSFFLPHRQSLRKEDISNSCEMLTCGNLGQEFFLHSTPRTLTSKRSKIRPQCLMFQLLLIILLKLDKHSNYYILITNYLLSTFRNSFVNFWTQVSLVVELVDLRLRHKWILSCILSPSFNLAIHLLATGIK